MTGWPSAGPDRRQVAYTRIKQAIMTGEFAPGYPLVEAALAAWCDVSRTPVREALNRLEQDGLVERGDRGLLVRQHSPQEILDIYETRVALESTVARLAADRRLDHDILLMRRLNARMLEMTAVDGDACATVNVEFHRTLWTSTRNRSLIDVLERLNMHLGRHSATTLVYPGRWESAVGEHVALVDAIEARDVDAAEAIARLHFTAARDIRLEVWDH